MKLDETHLEEIGKEYIDYHNKYIYGEDWYSKANSADAKSREAD